MHSDAEKNRLASNKLQQNIVNWFKAIKSRAVSWWNILDDDDDDDDDDDNNSCFTATLRPLLN